jgi:hypothetical protein
MWLLLTGLILSVMAPPLTAEQDERTIPRQRPVPARSQVHKLEELAWPQIDAFNRQRTMFILPLGMVEEHGPHLPVGADTAGALGRALENEESFQRKLDEWLAQRRKH